MAMSCVVCGGDHLKCMTYTAPCPGCGASAEWTSAQIDYYQTVVLDIKCPCAPDARLDA